MKHSRQQSLARPGLPFDQYRWQPLGVALALEESDDPTAQVLDLRAIADEIGERHIHGAHHTARNETWSEQCSRVDHHTVDQWSTDPKALIYRTSRLVPRLPYLSSVFVEIRAVRGGEGEL